MKHLNPDLIDPATGILLTPSYHGEECMGNGKHEDHACCCNECDHFLICYPELADRYWPDLESKTVDELEALLDRLLDDPSAPMWRVAAVHNELTARQPIKDLKVERIVANCVADLAMEGMICTEEDIARMRRVASGETTADEEIAQIKARYRK